MQTNEKCFLQTMHLQNMYQEDLALNNLQWLICHKIQPNQTIVCESKHVSVSNL